MDATLTEVRCPHCHGKDIVPSLPRGIWDAVMSGCGRVPRHCRFCERRFHPKLEDVERDAAVRAEVERVASATDSKVGF